MLHRMKLRRCKYIKHNNERCKLPRKNKSRYCWMHSSGVYALICATQSLDLETSSMDDTD